MAYNNTTLCASIGVLALLLGGCSTPGPVDSREMSIPRQPLDEALAEWAVRTGYQVIVPDCPQTLRPAKAIQASDPRDELEQLLAGTRLRYEVINLRSVGIFCPD